MGKGAGCLTALGLMFLAGAVVLAGFGSSRIFNPTYPDNVRPVVSQVEGTGGAPAFINPAGLEFSDNSPTNEEAGKGVDVPKIEPFSINQPSAEFNVPVEFGWPLAAHRVHPKGNENVTRRYDGVAQVQIGTHGIMSGVCRVYPSSKEDVYIVADSLKAHLRNYAKDAGIDSKDLIDLVLSNGKLNVEVLKSDSNEDIVKHAKYAVYDFLKNEGLLDENGPVVCEISVNTTSSVEIGNDPFGYPDLTPGVGDIGSILNRYILPSVETNGNIFHPSFSVDGRKYLNYGLRTDGAESDMTLLFSPQTSEGGQIGPKIQEMYNEVTQRLVEYAKEISEQFGANSSIQINFHFRGGDANNPYVGARIKEILWDACSSGNFENKNYTCSIDNGFKFNFGDVEATIRTYLSNGGE